MAVVAESLTKAETPGIPYSCGRSLFRRRSLKRIWINRRVQHETLGLAAFDQTLGGDPPLRISDVYSRLDAPHHNSDCGFGGHHVIRADRRY